MPFIGTGAPANGKAHVLELANRATVQKLAAETVSGLTIRLDNHESGLNTNAHGISNIAGLQSALDGKSNVGHAHTIASVTSLQSALDGKEPVFSKNTGFNKNFGSTSGTVCQGNDSRLSDARMPLTHTHAIDDVSGLQSALDSKQDVISGVTGSFTFVISVDFTAQTVVTGTATVTNGIITSIV